MRVLSGVLRTGCSGRLRRSGTAGTAVAAAAPGPARAGGPGARHARTGCCQRPPGGCIFWTALCRSGGPRPVGTGPRRAVGGPRRPRGARPRGTTRDRYGPVRALRTGPSPGGTGPRRAEPARNPCGTGTNPRRAGAGPALPGSRPGWGPGSGPGSADQAGRTAARGAPPPTSPRRPGAGGRVRMKQFQRCVRIRWRHRMQRGGTRVFSARSSWWAPAHPARRPPRPTVRSIRSAHATLPH